jgi:hypothetical protein
MILFFGCWLLLNLATGIAADIAIGRDTYSAIGLAGLLVANGLILGRAASGNWVSISHTLLDFVCLGWPAAALTGSAG